MSTRAQQARERKHAKTRELRGKINALRWLDETLRKQKQSLAREFLTTKGILK